MTPVERLQAAIEKLEAMRAACTPGDWDFESMPETGESRIYSEADGFAFMAATTVTFYPVPGGMKPDDAELIVILHRTIDAQLAILRAGIRSREAAVHAVGVVGEGVTVDQLMRGLDRAALELADAIIGSDQ